MLTPLELLSAISSVITISGHLATTPPQESTRDTWRGADIVPDYVIAQDVQRKFPGMTVYGSTATDGYRITEEYYQNIPVTACEQLPQYTRVVEQTWYGRPGGNPETMTRQEFQLHRESRAKLWVMRIECRAGGVQNLTSSRDYKLADIEVVEGSTRCVTEHKTENKVYSMRETCEEADRQEFVTTKVGQRLPGALLRPHETQVQDFKIGGQIYRMFEEHIVYRGSEIKITGIAAQIQPTVWQVVDRF